MGNAQTIWNFNLQFARLSHPHCGKTHFYLNSADLELSKRLPSPGMPSLVPPLQVLSTVTSLTSYQACRFGRSPIHSTWPRFRYPNSLHSPVAHEFALARAHAHTRARTQTHIHSRTRVKLPPDPTSVSPPHRFFPNHALWPEERKGSSVQHYTRVSFLPPIFSLRYLASLTLYCCCCQGFLMRGVWSRAASAETTCSDFIYTSVFLNFIHFIISDVCYLNSFYPRYSLRKLFLFQLFVT